MTRDVREEKVIVLDFGSQYAQLIARRVREQKVFAQILPCHAPLVAIQALNPIGVILSGGPANVYGTDAPRCAEELFALGIPILGICYGTQVMCEVMGGKVLPAESREFGMARLSVTKGEQLFDGLPEETQVWMSHGDQVAGLPDNFETLARTETCPHAAIRHREKPLYGVQFHPEVHHTPCGKELLRNFLYKICKASGSWQMESFITETVAQLRERIGTGKVVLGLSGGV
ncbi:MAG: glutamine-hydrolyzing GMP synthase, partial [Planctomycetes bacterium]|nr:glutamine-hydrolyzing GMP synthase [Planctomycetota bacterium]